MLAIETEDATEVSCVILPLRTLLLVVPAVCVAEVLPWRSPEPLPGAPRWCVGTLSWHGAVIPVLDHETVAGLEVATTPATGRCLAVINRTTPDAGCPFYALVVPGIPRLVQVAQVDLSAERGAEARAELLRVRVGTELLVIPDLAMLEQCVAELSPPAP